MNNDHNESERRFALRIRPERHHQPWHAKLEDEQHETLEFSSPLLLARFLANLEAGQSEDFSVRRASTGLQ